MLVDDLLQVRRSRFRRMTVMALMGLGLSLAGRLEAQEAAALFSKGPYLQAPGADTMTVMWESLTNHPGTVRFGAGRRLDREAGPILPRTMKGISTTSRTNITATKTNVTTTSRTNLFYVYEAVLPNLEPATAYTYSIELAGTRTSPRQFKTFGGNPERVRFIAYGDTRSQPKIHTALARQFKDHAPDFILHTGDLVAKGKDYALWSKEYFVPLAKVIDEVPVLPVLGNHEDDGSNYLAYFHLPAGERWYSFDIGPVHLLALDYHYPKASHAQFSFASNDLMTCQAPWKIVFVHYPVFNVGGHDSAWGHDAYLPLFHRAGVDLVIAGHSHLYERFRPVAPKASADKWAITHITTGGGGAELAPSYDHPALAVRASTNHFIVFEATTDSLKGRTILVSGKTFDQFELKKSGGQPPPSYLAQTYPEELLKLSDAAGTNLLGRLVAVPTPDQPARVMFTIRALKNYREPVELEISPAPDSAPYYKLVDGPLRVTTPLTGEPDKVVWAEVAATGRKAAKESRSRDLSPALVFAAKVKNSEGETVAYGQKCRVSDTAIRAAKKLQ